MTNAVHPRLVLSERHLVVLMGVAACAYPHECCGLLIGEGDSEILVSDLRESANMTENASTEFMIDPQIQFDALRSLRNADRRVVGHYHSHPNGNPLPSDADMKRADGEDVWVIIPVARGKAAMPRAFRFVASKGTFSELPIVVEN